MAEDTYMYLILDGKTCRVGARMKAALDIYVRTGDIALAQKETGAKNFATYLKKPAIIRWIDKKREMCATREDFNDDEYWTFLIKSIRGEEVQMDSKKFGKRLRAAEIFGRGKGMSGEGDIGTIKFVLPGQSDRVQAKPNSA